MSRRSHASSNAEFENHGYSADSSQQNNYEHYSSGNYSQEAYGYQSSNDYGQNYGYYSTTENSYNSNQGTNASSHYGDGGQFDSFNQDFTNHFSPSPSVNPIPHVSFPTVKSSPIVQQSAAPDYGSQYNYRSSAQKSSWISAFSSGGFENEPPLLEGIK